MKPNSGAQVEISVDGVPRTYRDRQDIALQTARLLKSRNPNSVVKMRAFGPARRPWWRSSQGNNPYGPQDASNRARLRVLRRQRGLRHLLRRVVHRAHL